MSATHLMIIIEKMKPAVLIIIYTISIASLAEEILNYCHDEQTNQQWAALEIKGGTHPDIVGLSKYRTELCKKIDAGELSVEQATVEFENERERVLSKIKRGGF